jgi:mono/diheme cytochrome c family protein
MKINMAASERKPVMARITARHRAASVGLLLAPAMLLAGCSVEWQNTQAAQEVEQRAKLPGSVYVGWRVFQDRCALCHGPAATGGAGGPDLLPRVRAMGPRQFVSAVLDRYDWGLPAAKAGTDGAARQALIDDVVQGRQGELTMPAWRGEPIVSAKIADLYAYVSARAEGTQGPDRPAP